MTDVDLSILPGLKGSNGKPLPEGKFFCPGGPAERKVSRRFRFRRQVVQWASYSLMTGQPVQFVGYYGCGKTGELEAFLAATGWPYEKVQCTAQTEPMDLIGQRIPDSSGAFRFIPGPFIRALINKTPVLLDELGKLHEETKAALNAVLDGSRIDLSSFGVTPEDGIGPVIERPEGFAVLATGNSTGSGDETGLFVSDRQHGAEQNSRWLTVLVDYLDRDTEEEVVKATVPDLPEEFLTALLGFAEETRESHKTPTESGLPNLALPMGTREVLQSADAAVAAASLREGIEVAYLNGLPSEDRHVADGCYANIIGGPDDEE